MFIAGHAMGDELLYTTSNWFNSSTETSMVFGGKFPRNTEAADDFLVNGDIARVVISGLGCSQCSAPVVEGVYVRFYAWTPSGPGALQQEFFLAGDDPGFVYNPETPSTLEITLPQAFSASGLHYMSVQINFDDNGGHWAMRQAAINNPIHGPVYWRDNLQGGIWEIDYYSTTNFTTDASFELWGVSKTVTPWKFVPSPPQNDAYLWDVDGKTPGDVWAVGHERIYYNQFSYDQHSLAIHWNGSKWTRVASPTIGAYAGGGTDVDLHDVVSLAPDDAWAVGSYKIQHPVDGFIGFQTFTIHWDGSQWSFVDSPVTPPGMTGAFLHSVVAFDANDVFATGQIVDPVPGDQVDWIAYTLHWDGNQWSPLPPPPTPGFRNQFDDMAIVDADTLIMVGGHSGNTNGARDQPYVATWDIASDSWTLINVPVPPGQNFLEAVTVIAPDDIWIVGTNDPIDGPFRPLFLHFDGSNWTIVEASDFAYYGGTLRGVAAVHSNEIYASGNFTVQQGGFTRQLLMKFDGKRWRQVDTDPSGPDGGTLFAADATGKGEVWAVGIQNGPLTVTQHLPSRGLDPADLVFSNAQTGRMSSGNLDNLAASDDSGMHLASDYLINYPDWHHTELKLTASSDHASPSTIDVTVESTVDYAWGYKILYLRNWKTGKAISIGKYPLSTDDQSVTITNIDASNYVDPDGNIELIIKHSVIVPRVFFQFDSFIDHVEISVR